MAIYLALLDENPADRKQAERLLYRESSFRAERGEALYFDTYGSEDAFFPFMEKYDLAFIDVHSKRDGMMVVVDMMKKGCGFPVFLCSGETDYKEQYSRDERFDFDNLHYLDKPLKASDYRNAIDLALSIKRNKPERLEIRGKEETLYIRPEEIIYVIEKKGETIISLKGDRSFHSNYNLHEFMLTLGDDAPGFIKTSGNTVINMDEVVSVSGNSFKMSNEAIIKFSLFSRPGILKAWENRVRKVSIQNPPDSE